MQKIKLTQGKVALIDDTDFEEVSRFKWHAHFDGYNWYAKKRNGSKHHISMHNFLMEPPTGVEIDHRDRNGLNNQRRNLRICTHRQNSSNRHFRTANKSGFKGVSWKSANRQWCAQIKIRKKVYHLGLFNDPKQAARAYDKAALSNFRQYALTNKRLGLL